jgi:hypothetical protein
MVDRTYPLLVKALTDADPGNRRAILSDYEAALGRLLPGREITEDGSIAPMLANPKYGDNYYNIGMDAVRKAWRLCGNVVEKRLFVEQCLISDKGYSKSARGIVGWVPPSKASTDVMVERWLDQMSNTNILTGDSLEGDPTAIGDQLTARFLAKGAAPPAEDELIAFWMSLLKFLSDSKDLHLRKESIQAVISQDATDLISGLRAVLPNARQRVYDLNATTFDTVYERLVPREERGDPEAVITFNLKRAARLDHWAKSIEFSLPEIKKLRFAASSSAPSTLEDQLNAIKLAPGIKPQEAAPIELMKLKGEVKQRARAKLGGPDVVLSTIDPKQLDGSLFAAEVAKQFLSEKANLEDGAAKTKAGLKKLPAWPPPK